MNSTHKKEHKHAPPMVYFPYHIKLTSPNSTDLLLRRPLLDSSYLGTPNEFNRSISPRLLEDNSQGISSSTPNFDVKQVKERHRKKSLPHLKMLSTFIHTVTRKHSHGHREDLGQVDMPFQVSDRIRSQSGTGTRSAPPISPLAISGKHYLSEENVQMDTTSPTAGVPSTSGVGGGAGSVGHTRHSSASSSGSSMRNAALLSGPPSRIRQLLDHLGRPRSKSDASQHQSQITQITAAHAAANKRDSTDPLFVSTGNAAWSGAASGGNNPSSPLVPIGEDLHLDTLLPSPGSIFTSPHTVSKGKKRSRSPKTATTGIAVSSSGSIIDKLRAISGSSPNSFVAGGGDNSTPSKMPNPAKLPMEQPRSTMAFTQKNLKARHRKAVLSESGRLSYPFPEGSDDMFPKSVNKNLSKSEEALIASIGATTCRDDLERVLSPIPDPSTDEGTAMAALQYGVRRVSENKRFLMLSKSPLRNTDEFLEGGVELLGDNDAYAVFFQHSTCYDVMPNSAKLVALDCKLQVGRAFRALVFNGVRAAPIWDNEHQHYCGMLTITDFIKILHHHLTNNSNFDDFETQTIDRWRELIHQSCRVFHHLLPESSLFTAVATLGKFRVHRLPVIDSRTGNALHIVTHKRLLRYLYVRRWEMPLPSFLQLKLADCFQVIGTWTNISTVYKTTPIKEAIRLFVEKSVSALPVVSEDGENRLLDIYAKFDTIHLAATGGYKNMEIKVSDALKLKKSACGVYTCLKTDLLSIIIEKIVTREIHRLVVVDNDLDKRVIGIVSLSDLLNFIIMKQGELPTNGESPMETTTTTSSNITKPEFTAGEPLASPVKQHRKKRCSGDSCTASPTNGGIDSLKLTGLVSKGPDNEDELFRMEVT